MTWTCWILRLVTASTTTVLAFQQSPWPVKNDDLTHWRTIQVEGMEPLRLLERYSEEEPRVGDLTWPGGRGLGGFLAARPGIVRGRSVLDVGAGSGVASMVAQHLEAKEILAIDTDIDALRRIRETSNGTIATREINFFTDELPPADVLIAADTIFTDEMADHMARCVHTAYDNGSDVVIADSQRWCWESFLDRLPPDLRSKGLAYDFNDIFVLASRRYLVNIFVLLHDDSRLLRSAQLVVPKD